MKQGIIVPVYVWQVKCVSSQLFSGFLMGTMGTQGRAWITTTSSWRVAWKAKIRLSWFPLCLSAVIIKKGHYCIVLSGSGLLGRRQSNYFVWETEGSRFQSRPGIVLKWPCLWLCRAFEKRQNDTLTIIAQVKCLGKTHYRGKPIILFSRWIIYE